MQQNNPQEMTFWEHLSALRIHLIRSVVVLLLLSIVAFLYKDFVFEKIILPPKDFDFITNQWLNKISKTLGNNDFFIDENPLQIINVNMSGQFTTHLQMSFMMGLLLGMPYMLWEIWRFIKPALTEKEVQNVRKSIIAAVLLFYIGVIFSYYLIVPLTIHFLGSYQISDTVTNMINLSSYISTVLGVTFAVGLAFELPITIYFLAKIGIITPKFLIRNRKIMIVLLLIIAGIITPPDVFSQIIVMIPLYALYELSIFITKKVSLRQV